jgi:hypothetical protein
VIRFLSPDEIFTNESLDTFVVSCIVRLGTMSMQMLNTLRIHSRLTDAMATSPALQCSNSFVVEDRQPGTGLALAWGCTR